MATKLYTLARAMAATTPMMHHLQEIPAPSGVIHLSNPFAYVQGFPAP